MESCKDRVKIHVLGDQPVDHPVSGKKAELQVAESETSAPRDVVTGAGGGRAMGRGCALSKGEASLHSGNFLAILIIARFSKNSEKSGFLKGCLPILHKCIIRSSILF